MPFPIRAAIGARISSYCPALARAGRSSNDGLTWTFHLPKDRVWSDGKPIRAADWVFTLQRYARPDYDFEWFYAMGNIVNWSKVVNGTVPPDQLGAKAVDEYTFTVTTDQPTPYLPKIFAQVWVVPSHILKDRLDKGTWAMDQKNWVFAGPYKLVEWNKGKNMVLARTKSTPVPSSRCTTRSSRPSRPA